MKRDMVTLAILALLAVFGGWRDISNTEFYGWPEGPIPMGTAPVSPTGPLTYPMDCVTVSTGMLACKPCGVGQCVVNYHGHWACRSCLQMKGKR